MPFDQAVPWPLPAVTRGSPAQHLRARGNLEYLDFIRLVEHLWTQSIGVQSDSVTPRVPFHASFTALDDPDYPCIVYGLEMRKAMQHEPKARQREIFANTANQDVLVRGQRFENVIMFTAIDRVLQDGTEHVDEIIDTFEDFMFECTPVFKELGLSDIFYGRRLSDKEEPREGLLTIVKRSVMYQVITEKIIRTDVNKLNQIFISARTFVAGNQPIPATPNYDGITVEIRDQVP